MRVCLVTREYPPLTAYSGGIGTQFATLAPELVRQGHETHVVVPPDAAAVAANGEHDGVVVHVAPRSRLGWGHGVRDAIRSAGRFDVVFAPEWSGDAWWYSRGRSAGPLVTNLTSSLEQILSLNSEWHRKPKVRLQHAVQSRRERAQSEGSDALVACSESIRRWSAQLWNLDGLPAEVIPNMIDIERVRRLGSAEIPPVLADGPVIAYSGRLEIRKGVHILVEAMRAVWERVPDAQLVLCGHDGPWRSGSMRDHLTRLAGTFAPRLLFLGNLPPQQLYPILRQADVVALPSLWENFAIAALEALALGRPVVVTNAGGFPEMIADGFSGLLVPPGDPKALAAALLHLVEDGPTRERLGAGAAQRAQRFDKGLVTAEHASFFERVAERRM